MPVKYDRCWVYYDAEGNPHNLGGPTWEFNRVEDLQQHLDWIQEQVNKLKEGMPKIATINNSIPPIQVIEWQALNERLESAMEAIDHWKEACHLADSRVRRYWNQLQTAEIYLKQIRARMVADTDTEHYHKIQNPQAIVDLVSDAFEAINKLEFI